MNFLGEFFFLKKKSKKTNLIAFIVHTSQKYKGMFHYKIEKHMQKIQVFLKEKISPKKVTYISLVPSHIIISLK